MMEKKKTDGDVLIHVKWNIAHSAGSPTPAAFKCYWYKGGASMASKCLCFKSNE